MNVVGQGPALAGEDSINVHDEYVSQAAEGGGGDGGCEGGGSGGSSASSGCKKQEIAPPPNAQRPRVGDGCTTLLSLKSLCGRPPIRALST